MHFSGWKKILRAGFSRGGVCEEGGGIFASGRGSEIPTNLLQVVTAVTVVVAAYTLVSSWVVYLSWATVDYDVVLHFKKIWLSRKLSAPYCHTI